MTSIYLRAGYTVDSLLGTLTLAYDTAEPLMVTIDFGYCRTRRQRIIWMVSRDVLAEGLIGRAGLADVVCWNREEIYHIAFTSDEGAATVLLFADDVRALLVEAEDLVPYGREVINFDRELKRLLKAGGAR